MKSRDSSPVLAGGLDDDGTARRYRGEEYGGPARGFIYLGRGWVGGGGYCRIAYQARSRQRPVQFRRRRLCIARSHHRR